MGEGKTFKVEVKAKPAKDGDPPEKLQFSLESDLKKDRTTDELVFDKSKNNMKKADHYLIEFDLDDKSGLSLRFAPNPMEAFWVKMDSTECPKAASYSNEVYAVGIDKSGEKLTVRNEDSRCAMFAYALRFLKKGADPNDPANYIPFDPIGDNRNGGVDGS